MELADSDLCGDPDLPPGPKPTVFIALPNVPIHVFDHPDHLHLEHPGHQAWFSDHEPCVRHAFYFADPGPDPDPDHHSELAGLRDFRKICGAHPCRRGDIHEVRATWAAQLQQWQRGDPDPLASAIVQASARPPD